MSKDEIMRKMEEFERKDEVIAKTENFIIRKRNKNVEFKYKGDSEDRYHIISCPFFLFYEDEVENIISGLIKQLESIKEQLNNSTVS